MQEQDPVQLEYVAAQVLKPLTHDVVWASAIRPKADTAITKRAVWRNIVKGLIGLNDVTK